MYNQYLEPHDGGTPGTRERQGSVGTDTLGISVTSGNGLHPVNGDVSDIDLMTESVFEFADGTRLDIEQLESGPATLDALHTAAYSPTVVLDIEMTHST